MGRYHLDNIQKKANHEHLVDGGHEWFRKPCKMTEDEDIMA